jgi:hypothetical protein
VDWPVVEEGTREVLKCSFTVEALHSTGIIGHIVMEAEGDVQMLICLGFDHTLKPISFIMPFSGNLYDSGLRQWNILKALYRMSGHGEDWWDVEDPETLLVSVRGGDGCIGYSSENMALDVEVDHATGGQYNTTIRFDKVRFLNRNIDIFDFSQEGEYLGRDVNPSNKLERIEDALDGPRRRILSL